MNIIEVTSVKRKTLFLIFMLLTIGLFLTLAVYFYMQSKQTVKPSWLKLNASMTYKQFFVWTGHNETEYMTWNITQLRDDLANLHLISHGVTVTDEDVVITRGESNWTINTFTREIVDSSDPNYIGAKCPFWIETDVTIGSTIDTLYGTSDIAKSEPIYVLGQQRDCWVVEYSWPTAAMKRWYDKSSGIVLKIHVVLYREDVTIEITETALQTNVDFES